MKQGLIAAALWAGLALPAHAATAPPLPAAPPPTEAAAPGRDYTPLVIGAGAVAGVLAFNVLALGWEAVPMASAIAEGGVVPAEMSVAMSRVYAVSSAVAGGLIADYLYTR